MQKREVAIAAKKGLSISDVILVGVLLAVGAVLKFFLSSAFTIVKPNFIIAMYCLAILMIKPRFFEAVIIGLLAGAVCQLFPGTPYVNLVSEPIGAAAMYFLMKIPMNFGRFSFRPVITTLLSTLASGFAFIGIVYLALYSGANVTPMPLAVFCGIIFGTAAINCIIVQVLYVPLKLALKRGDA